jgi:hypothetical protein
MRGKSANSLEVNGWGIQKRLRLRIEATRYAANAPDVSARRLAFQRAPGTVQQRLALWPVHADIVHLLTISGAILPELRPDIQRFLLTADRSLSALKIAIADHRFRITDPKMP